MPNVAARYCKSKASLSPSTELILMFQININLTIRVELFDYPFNVSALCRLARLNIKQSNLMLNAKSINF